MACCLYILHVVICILCFLLQNIEEKDSNPETKSAEKKNEQLTEIRNKITASDLPQETLSHHIETNANNFLRQKKTDKEISIRSFSREEKFDISETHPKL